MPSNKVQLNPNQKKAVNHKVGPLLVVAGAGTGKTRVITERIRYLIQKQKHNPNEILALTFTEKAATEMLDRIGDIMPLGYEEPWVNTFHSFADRLLKTEGLALGYHNTPILRDINLEISEGMCLCILGPNGTGKTTLLKGLLGLISPMKGRIAWYRDGIPVNPQIGYVPQKEYLDPAYPLTVYEVVLMGTYKNNTLSPFVSHQQKETVYEVLEEVSMREHSNMLFSKCSGGQRQRVLIARALATKPSVLILDEFTVGIDISAQKQLGRLITVLNQTHNISIILVTQDVKAVPGIVKEVIWVQKGHVEHGPVEVLLREEHIDKIYGKSKAEGVLKNGDNYRFNNRV